MVCAGQYERNLNYLQADIKLSAADIDKLVDDEVAPRKM